MKLKYPFVLREVAGSTVAVIVGPNNGGFTGMVKLNSTGAFLMDCLNTRPYTKAELLQALLDRYDVTPQRAEANLTRFLNILKDGNLLELDS